MSIPNSDNNATKDVYVLIVVTLLSSLSAFFYHNAIVLFMSHVTPYYTSFFFPLSSIVLLYAAHIPLYLYPFLNTVSRHRPFEYLRLTSLGVIGALVKVDDTEVVNFLLQTEIIPLCLRIMETGSELSKTVATFIVQKIILDEMGLTYVCTTAERFYAVSGYVHRQI